MWRIAGAIIVVVAFGWWGVPFALLLLLGCLAHADPQSAYYRARRAPTPQEQTPRQHTALLRAVCALDTIMRRNNRLTVVAMYSAIVFLFFAFLLGSLFIADFLETRG